MKKLTIAFAALALLAGSSAFATDGKTTNDGKSVSKVSKTVQTAFLDEFSKAKDVSWATTEDFYFANFKLDGKNVEVAYNEKGDLLGVSRKLTLAELPANLSQGLKSDYAGYELSNNVTEIVYEGTTFYYVTVKGASKILKLKCYADGQIFVDNKVKI